MLATEAPNPMVEENHLPLPTERQARDTLIAVRHPTMLLRPSHRPRYTTLPAFLLPFINLCLQVTESDSNSAVNLLVLGSRGSGKTTFIRNATGKDRSRTSTHVIIKDKYYRIRLIELLFEDVDFSSERRIEWPAYVDGVPLPEVDGVFCLYDVADKESVADIPAALSKCPMGFSRRLLVPVFSDCTFSNPISKHALTFTQLP
jgi:hypothetical protein